MYPAKFRGRYWFIKGFVSKCIDQPMNVRQELPCFEKNELTLAFVTNPKYYCSATRLTGIASVVESGL